MTQKSENLKSIRNNATLVIDDIILKKLSLTNSSSLFKIYSNSEIIDCYADKVIKSSETEVKFTNRIMSNSDFIWTIRLAKQPKKIVGVCALHHWNKETNEIEIGGTLLPKYWGENIMKSAFTLLIKFAYNKLNVTSIIGRTSLRNLRAIKLVEKLGFNKVKIDGNEAIMKKYR